MVRSKTELLDALKAKFGDDTSDETISIIEDVSDTFGDFEDKTKDATDWKTKYEENDKNWREKYKERFFTKTEEVDDGVHNDPPDEEKKIKTFEDLFKKEGD